jgi:hypothetical protein
LYLARDLHRALQPLAVTQVLRAAAVCAACVTVEQEPCQWLWSWLLLETIMGLHAHKVCMRIFYLLRFSSQN